MKKLTNLFCFFSLSLALFSGPLFADFDHSDDDNLLYDRERRDDRQGQWERGSNPHNSSYDTYNPRGNRYRDNNTYYYNDNDNGQYR